MHWVREALGKGPPDAREQMLAALRQDLRLGPEGDAAVDAIAAVPRELFVPERFAELAYADEALELAPGATISAPSMVAGMVAAARPAPGLRALEVGSGSGYAACVLAAAGLRVTGVEILADLVARARAAVAQAGFAGRVELFEGDGMLGWPAGAPYDRVLASAAVEAVPQAWIEQVGPGGMIVYPEARGPDWDMLMRLERSPDGSWIRVEMQPCRFVPMRT